MFPTWRGADEGADSQLPPFREWYLIGALTRQETKRAPQRSAQLVTGLSVTKWTGAGLNRRHLDFQSPYGPHVTPRHPTKSVV